MNKETERLVKELKRELHAIKTQVKEKKNPKLSKTYREVLSTLK